MKTSYVRNAAGALMLATLGIGASAYTTPTIAAGDTEQIFNRRNPTTPAQNVRYARAEAEVIAKRLYRALLGRDIDPDGTPGTVSMLEQGQRQKRIAEIIQSAEFRKSTAGKPAREVLDQIYQGMLDRGADESGVNAFLGQVQNRRYADVVLQIMDSPEFRDKLRAESGVTTGGGGATTTGDTAAAVGCMDQIVEKVRNDLPGAVLLRFENASTQGVAIDVLDNNRRLNYNCTNGATYSYEDGRNSRSAPAETDFPNDTVRSCQGAVRAQVGRDRAGADVAFESAGVMPTGGQQAVRGLGFERPQGANFMYQCDMDGTRVVNSSYRGR